MMSPLTVWLESHFGYWTPALLVALAIATIGCAVYLSWKFSRWRRAHTMSEGIYQPAPVLEPHRSLRVKEFQIHFAQEGSGPHLVLLHGLGASIHCWRFLFHELKRDYRVTALDLPGFGDSTKVSGATYDLDAQTHRLLEFFEKLGIRQARLVGSSMGGAIALWLAHLFPKRFFEVIAISPALLSDSVPLPVGQWAAASPLLSHGVSEFLVRSIFSRVVERQELVSNENVKRLLRPYRRDPAAISSFMKATELIRDPRLPRDLKDLTSRTLILWGGRDRITPARHVDILKNHLPQAQFLIHPEGGHHLMEDEPAWVLHHLREFFGPFQI